jgi:hypothetical protein
MIVSEKIRHFFKASAILLFVLIFLILGFCPVRDFLFSSLGSAPQTTQHKKISEIKTFTYHICQQSGPDKKMVLAHISNANPLAFITVVILIFCTGIVDLQKMAVRYQDIAAISSNQIPIYLRNKILRI